MESSPATDRPTRKRNLTGMVVLCGALMDSHEGQNHKTVKVVIFHCLSLTVLLQSLLYFFMIQDNGYYIDMFLYCQNILTKLELLRSNLAKMGY